MSKLHVDEGDVLTDGEVEEQKQRAIELAHTQTNLALQLGLPRQTVSAWYSGVQPSSKNRERLRRWVRAQAKRFPKARTDGGGGG